ncbi:hypothetical protein PUR61_08320 [Streptomyces sp. BE20]|uniref:hypothetical protein n=1 Tax=unclassified Streptomyces TaxID=2593676 RepID=UPI002E75FE81|nr:MULTISPECIES: hypothetical protein [unclassified Streptomyces]MED7951134.1 hypothetical protein [Streptomyces sp. BE303]MEE1822199.1 hypothetical protein [Streptomyces sp. BE20]
MPRPIPPPGTSRPGVPRVRLPTRRAPVAALCALATVLGAAACGAPTGAPRGTHGPPPESRSGAAPDRLLPAALLPGAAAQRWRPLPSAAVRRTTSGVRLNECASVVGAETWQQQAYVGVQGTPALQEIFTFPDAATAQDSYRGLLDGMSDCQDRSRALQAKHGGVADTEVVRTAAIDRGTAWSRRWTAVEGLSAAGPQIDHLYAVRHDTALTVVHFDERADPAITAHDTGADSDVLTAIARRLG